MTVETELIAAIAADPVDDAPQLVIADWLIAQGDPRGELIVLDHRERHGALHDPDALERLLLLAAELSFPRAHPDDPLLPFERVEGAPLTYRLVHDGKRYTAVYTGCDLNVYERELGALEVEVDDEIEYGTRFWHYLDLGERWTDDQTRVILTILSDAIRAKAPLDELRFPYGHAALPSYDGGPLRCYRLPMDFTVPREIPRNRYGLAARDYQRWHAIWHRLRGR